MQIDNKKVLLIIVIATLILIPAVIFSFDALRIILGFPLVLFFPGYTLLSALFHKRGKIDGIEKVALSFGISIAIVPLIGLILNFTPWGISLYSTLTSVSLFILIAAAAAWYRLKMLPGNQHPGVTFSLNLTGWRGAGKLDKALYAVLAVVVLGTIGYFAYFIITPNQGERFTEFYILDAEGKAVNYPAQAVLGEPLEFTVGIMNHEDATTSYRVTMEIDGAANTEFTVTGLGDEERWQELVSFLPQKTGDEQKVVLKIYRNEEEKPYNNIALHFFIDVTEPL